MLLTQCVLLVLVMNSLIVASEVNVNTDQRSVYQIPDNGNVNSKELLIHLLDSLEDGHREGVVYEYVEVKRAEIELLDKRTLIKLHGTFMVVAWMGTTTIGVLIAR